MAAVTVQSDFGAQENKVCQIPAAVIQVLTSCMTLDKSLNLSESLDSCLYRKLRAVSARKGFFEDYRP